MIEALLASYAALWVLMLVNVVLLVGTLRALGLLLARSPAPSALVVDNQGPPVGTLVTPDRRPVIEWRAGKDRLLMIFLSTTCALCHKIAPSVGAINGRAQPLVFIHGSGPAADEFLSLLDKRVRASASIDRRAFDSFQVEATPFAVVLDREYRVTAKGIVNSLQQLESLLLEERRTPHVHAG